MPLLLAFALLAGCSKAEEETSPAALLGSGEWAWEDLDEGSHLPVIQGPQGGYHLLVSVRIAGMEAGDPENLADARNPTTTFEVLQGATNLTPNSTFIQGLDPLSSPLGEWSHEMIGRLAILDIEDDSDIDGASLSLRVTVEDVDGNSASDKLEFVAFPDPRNE